MSAAAIDAGGSSLRDFIQSNGSSGYFQRAAGQAAKPRQVVEVDDAAAVDSHEPRRVQPLHHGFNHQVTPRQGGQAVGGSQPLCQRLAVFSGQAPFGHQLVPHVQQSGLRGLCGPCLFVEQVHGAARLGGDLGDAPAHSAGAHNAHV